MEIEKYKDLPNELYEQFDRLSDEAYESFLQKRYYESFRKYEECLSIFPEPKGDYGDYSNVMEWMIENYLAINDYFNAKKWVEELGLVFKNQGILGDWDFLKGKVYFESGDFNTAWESFNNAYRKTGVDCFKEQDLKYLDFYRHPEKFIKKDERNDE